MSAKWSFWEAFDVSILVILFTSSLGAIVVDYGLHAYITPKTQLTLMFIAGVIAFAFYKKLEIPKIVAISLIIAVALIPYVQFVVGKMDVYAVDPPELKESVTVTEIRIKMGTFYMTNTKGEEIAVMKDIPEKKLHPGGNEVHLGTINMPPGTYIGGRMKLERIEVDIQIDMEKEIELAMATAAKRAPKEASTDTIRESIREEIISTFSEQNLNQMAPQGMQFKNVRNDGEKAYFTASVDVPEIQVPFPRQIPYPTGTGGPDITLDIILDSQGYPTNVKPIMHMPPGAPQIEMPDFTSQLTSELSGHMPSQAGPGGHEMSQRMQRERGSKVGPGGCTSEAECKAYCEQEAHREECRQFSEADGGHGPSEEEMMQTREKEIPTGGGPGGCQSEAECANYCSQEANQDECMRWREAHK